MALLNLRLNYNDYLTGKSVFYKNLSEIDSIPTNFKGKTSKNKD